MFLDEFVSFSGAFSRSVNEYVRCLSVIDVV